VKTFTLRREQQIPGPIQEVFEFFANAQNLEAITPPWLGFQILTPLPIVMQAGTNIAYRIRVHGWPMKWLTEIVQWEPPVRFIDVQAKGPYRLWHHTHTFKAVGDRTLMRDVVEYALPFGWLGRLALRWMVQRDLKAIFDYRAAQLKDRFPSNP
jgi:ligand-binding SRPBCC domain-containing protein